MCKHTTYVPLHGHSMFSLGDGIATIDGIINKAKEMKSGAIGLSEHGNMSSFLNFYLKAKESNIKPIIGCELYHNDDYFNSNKIFTNNIHTKKNIEDLDIGDSNEENLDKFSTNHFSAYCTNYDGVKNLIQLSNFGYLNFYRKPLISTTAIFEKLNKNNIITTGCIKSKFNSLILMNDHDELINYIKKYKEVFEDNFYLEIQLNDLHHQKIINEFYKKISKKLNIKPVFALDYHYVNKDDWYIQYLLYVIKSKKTIYELTPDDWFYSVRDLYIKNIDEIYAIAKHQNFDIDFLEQAIDSTFEIRDKVNIEIELYKDNNPKFELNSDLNTKDYFRKLLLEKFNEKIKNNLIPKDKVQEYKDRLRYELKIIEDKNFIDYFLIIHDILYNFVYKVGGSTGVGRGSCGGCLILFILDITKIDPLKFNLLFERFINPERVDNPDIDTDIDSNTHSKVEDYLKQKYGENKVCHIINFNKFGIKSIIKDLCRIFRLDFSLSNKLTEYLNSTDPEITIQNALTDAEKIITSKKDIEVLNFLQQNKKIFLEYGSKMIGLIRQTGAHASGLLISNKDFVDSEIPIVKLKNNIMSAVPEGGGGSREVSELGFLKLDILGLNTASINNEAIRLIEEHYGLKNLENEIIKSDLNDINVYNEFKKGNCKDIFQFGSSAMIDLIKRVQPCNISELSAVNALFRPAAIECLTSYCLINTIDGLKPIKDLTINDNIFYLNNKNKIINTNKFKLHRKLSKKQVYKIKTKSGKEIFVSGKHQIFTEKGYIKAKDLLISDKIICKK